MIYMKASLNKLLIIICLLIFSISVKSEVSWANGGEDFKFVLAPYAWLTGINGNVGACNEICVNLR